MYIHVCHNKISFKVSILGGSLSENNGWDHGNAQPAQHKMAVDDNFQLPYD